MTLTTRTDQPRQPAGVPTGGQYATTAHAEPEFVLDPAAGSHADAAITELTTEQMLGAARQSVRTHAYRLGVPFVGEDDMVQDTMVALLTSKTSNGQVVLARPYVHAVARNIVAGAARGNLRAEDRKAYAIFLRRIAEIEAELGGHLSSAEEDQIAAKIRQDWPDPRHRPSADFVALARTRTLSVDRGVNDRGTTFGDVIANLPSMSTGMDHDDRAVDPDSPAAAAFLAQEGSRAGLRAGAWNAFAAVSGAPQVQPGTISRRRATAARAQIAAAGGVHAAAREWLRGDSTPENARALFSPFGVADDGDRDAVAERLVANAAYAEELWDTAVSAAARPAE